MRVASVTLLSVSGNRIEETLPNQIIANLKNELEKVERVQNVSNIYRLIFKILYRFLDRGNREIGNIELRYLVLIIKDEMENVDENTIKENYGNILNVVWPRVVKDTFDLVEKFGLPMPIIIPNPFLKKE